LFISLQYFSILTFFILWYNPAGIKTRLRCGAFISAGDCGPPLGRASAAFIPPLIEAGASPTLIKTSVKNKKAGAQLFLILVRAQGGKDIYAFYPILRK
jgi:hypothetical protein